MSADANSTKGSVEYGYVALRFVDDSFCFFMNSFVEIIEDECFIYSKHCGRHKFPKDGIEKINADNLLIWENNSLTIKGKKDDKERSPN